MDTEEIAALPIAAICHPDTLLYMWATGPKMEDAFQVMKAWGFQYRAMVFTWAKLTPRWRDNWLKWQHEGKTPEEVLAHLFHAGNGFWSMANAEFVMLGRRKGGKMSRVRKDIRSLVVEPVGAHSAKPKEVQRRIQRMLGPERRYLELFARPPVEPGWDALGLEISGKDIRIELEEIQRGVHPLQHPPAGDLREMAALPPLPRDCLMEWLADEETMSSLAADGAANDWHPSCCTYSA